MNTPKIVRNASACVCALALLGVMGCGDDKKAGTAPAPTNAAKPATKAPPSNTNTPAATPSPEDANIKAKATAALDKAGVTGVTVTVTNGELSASGEVPAAKWTAAMQALNEAGAKKVDNSKLVKGK